MSQSAFDINEFEFSNNGLDQIEDNHYAKSLWPVVYILNDQKKYKAYVGESTNIVTRIGNHLASEKKGQFKKLQLITSDKFNKSAALDIESNLIRYLHADQQFDLTNSNLGVANHNYYQKQELYRGLFESIWDKLCTIGIAKHSLLHLSNSDIFKYSPYKSLSREQEQGLNNILKCLVDNEFQHVIVKGGAGTGKTILAVYIIKLLLSDESIYTEELADSTTSILKELVLKFKQKYPNPKIGLVIPMTSFRNTLTKVLKNIKSVNGKIVISPAEAAKGEYDLLIVDEAHRLKRRKNITNYASFDKTAAALGLDKNTCSELDWVLLKSKKNIFFYDDQQSIKPSDVRPAAFAKLKNSNNTITTELKSQFRSLGGNQYSQFVKDLFAINLNHTFHHKEYELVLYDSLSEMVQAIKSRDAEFGLSRLVAGFAWPWLSKKNKQIFDINVDGVKLRWNSTNDDWINSKEAVDEVGCIHTTQGYDLNYTGIIFGKEISYDPVAKEIVINKENYHDRNGKSSIKDPEQLKTYIINIYKTIMLRAIRGTYIYVCDPELRKYLAKYITLKTARSIKPKIIPIDSVRPYVNAIPIYDLKVAAGGFSEQQASNEIDWLEAPQWATKDMFACYVIGESMNKVIPNGSLCLFRFNPAGSRIGKIVLVQHHAIDDPDNGGTYTIKRYYSEKMWQNDSLQHTKIKLQPESTYPEYQPIIINAGDGLKVIAEFIKVLI